MTTPSLHEQTGLSISVYNSLVSGGLYQFALNDSYTSWRHTTADIGGYWDARVSITGDIVELEEWLETGLNRHIELYNSGGQLIWEGFVNQVTFTAGRLVVTRGPMMRVANSVDLFYSTVDTSTTPPTLGIRDNVGLNTDATSIATYGTWQRILSTGGVNATEAQEIRDLYLEESKDPRTTQSGAATGAVQRVDLDLLGYGHLFQAYVYNSTTTGDQNLSAKLTAVIAADPNSLLTVGDITANTIQVGAWENDNTPAWSIVKDLVGKGDASSNRYLFQVLAGRKCYYTQQPDIDDIAYERRNYGDDDRFTTVAGAIVAPWDVQAGRWLFHPDFMVGRDISGVDPRKAFLERVTFTAPHSVTWQGGQNDRLSQKLAQLGLVGIGG